MSEEMIPKEEAVSAPTSNSTPFATATEYHALSVGKN
jgi:hypothetical protein